MGPTATELDANVMSVYADKDGMVEPIKEGPAEVEGDKKGLDGDGSTIIDNSSIDRGAPTMDASMMEGANDVESTLPRTTALLAAREAKKAEEAKRLEEQAEEAKKNEAPVNWLAQIRAEQLAKKKREAEEKQRRAERLKALLDSDSEDEDKIDYKGLVGNKLTDFMQKIENHVQAEQNLLDAWKKQDQEEAENMA